MSTSYIPFLSAPGWAHVMIILINIWIGVPYQMLIATGVLMNLPSDQLESARVDGATNFQIFRKITMPYLLFVTGPALITDFVKNINNFNVIYLLTQDVYTTTNQAMASSQAKEVDLLVTWLFRLTQDYYNYKMASAIGIIVFIICAVFTLVAFNRMIKGDKEEHINNEKMKDSRTSSIVLHNLLIAVLAFIWLVPIIWLVCTSFSAYSGMNTSTFFRRNGASLIT